MKALVFLANGFEEIEAITVIDILRRADIKVISVSINNCEDVIGAHSIKVKADTTILKLDLENENYKAIILPGGMPGSTNLKDNNRLIEIIKDFNSKNKIIAAICAAPIVLKEAGLTKGIKGTVYPGFEEDLEYSHYTKESVTIDKNIVTAKGPAYSIDFALSLVKSIAGDEKEKEVRKGLLL